MKRKRLKDGKPDIRKQRRVALKETRKEEGKVRGRSGSWKQEIRVGRRLKEKACRFNRTEKSNREGDKKGVKEKRKNRTKNKGEEKHYSREKQM